MLNKEIDDILRKRICNMCQATCKKSDKSCDLIIKTRNELFTLMKINENELAGDLYIKDAEIKNLRYLLKDLTDKNARLQEDKISCPRCGKKIEQDDVLGEWTCPLCFTIQHRKCRNLSDDAETKKLVAENARLKKIEKVARKISSILKENIDKGVKFEDKKESKYKKGYLQYCYVIWEDDLIELSKALEE